MANLACDGLIVQGLQAHLTTMMRELVLCMDHTVSFPRPLYEESGYELEMDYNFIFQGAKLRRKGNGEGSGGLPEVIQPLPWGNAPNANGSIVGFRKKLDGCLEFMSRFSMHTPHYFLEHHRKQSTSKGKNKTPNGATTSTGKGAAKKSTGAGGGKKQSKRKAPDTDEDEEGRRLHTHRDRSSGLTLHRSLEDQGENVGTRGGGHAPKEKNTVR